MKLSTADKQYITRKLHHAQNLFNTDHTAAGLTALGHIIASVASAVGSDPIADSTKAAIDLHLESERQLADCHEQREAAAAAAAVKPMCPSGLPAVFRDGSNAQPCPICGLHHNRHVVLVPLSGFAIDAVRHTGQQTIDISGRYHLGDRIAFPMARLTGKVAMIGEVIAVDMIASDSGIKNTATVRIIK